MRMPFWAILGHFGPFYVPFLAKAFSGKQETPIFWTCIGPILPQNHGFVASPKKGKSDFLKTRMPQKGTCFNLHCSRLHPEKYEKLFFRKHETLFLGLS
jgi:hypothetical protein